MSHHIVSHDMIQCHSISYHIISYYVVLYHIISYHIMHGHRRCPLHSITSNTEFIRFDSIESQGTIMAIYIRLFIYFQFEQRVNIRNIIHHTTINIMTKKNLSMIKKTVLTYFISLLTSSNIGFIANKLRNGVPSFL